MVTYVRTCTHLQSEAQLSFAFPVPEFAILIMASTSTRRASEGALFACLNLMRRLLPHRQKENLAGLLTLMPDEELAEELLQHVEQPLEEALDPETVSTFFCSFVHLPPAMPPYFPTAVMD